MATENETQYLPNESQVGSTATTVKDRAADAAGTVKDHAADVAGTVKDRAGDAAGVVKDRAADAASAVKQALPDSQQVKSAVNGAVDQAVGKAQEVLPDPEEVRQEFLAAAHRLQEILPDGDDLKTMVVRVAEEVRDDPDIRRHVEAAAEVASERLQDTVASGVQAATGSLHKGAEKAGLEDLGYVADRVGEIVTEGVGELVEETKRRALDSLPEQQPYQKK